MLKLAIAIFVVFAIGMHERRKERSYWTRQRVGYLFLGGVPWIWAVLAWMEAAAAWVWRAL